MTAQILQFKKSEAPSKSGEKNKKASVVRIKSHQELFMEAYEDVIGEWQQHASKNRLSEYIASKIPPSAVSPNATDYLNDLNVISKIEQKLKMQVAVFYPGCTPNQEGWMSTFHLGDQIFSTPPDMMSEATSRALLILLFMHFKAVLKSIGRDIL